MIDPLFDKICLVGLGLLGASLGHATRRGHLAREIIGADRDAGVCKRAEELSVVDSASTDLMAAVIDADLVILCTPVGTFSAIADKIAPALKPGAILTDVGSVKSDVVKSVGPHVPSGVHFIPAHPVAGTEKSGPDAGFVELFDGRWSILTPLPGTDKAAIDRLTTYWVGLGAKVEIMDPEHHDLVLAITSHIPHLIAYNIVGTAADLETVTQSEVIKFSAGGFRDFTRIAGSNPDMWRDIFLTNKDAVLEMLGRFSEDLSTLQRAIRWGDGEALHDLFTRTREIRKGVIDAGQD
ncbi:MAG: prephenate/arogenate dehydrogenase family protein [Pseudomonadota bacterium]